MNLVVSLKLMCVEVRGVNLTLNPWVNPDPLFTKPPFREAPNKGVKKCPSLQSPLSSGLGLGLRWVRPPK